MAKYSLKGLRVSIIGLGKSGIAAANLAASRGARVLASDSKPRSSGITKKLSKSVRAEFGGHTDALLSSDLVIKSPGIPGDLEILKKIKKNKIPITGEIEFALSLAPKPRRLIAITGTNGKTTTTTLVGEIFKNSGHKTIVAGNIGAPPAALTGKIGGDSNVILEVSSYQLEDMTDGQKASKAPYSFRPDISCILNITEDHIEHHHSMKNYIEAKAKIFASQRKNDFCVLNYDDPIVRKLAVKARSKVVFFSRKKILREGVYYLNGSFVVKLSGGCYSLEFKPIIPGMHNVENILASIAICTCAGIKPADMLETISSFKGVEHRIELVREIKGVRYINDSKGTNVDSTKVALESINGKIVLILGGKDKGFPYTPLKELVRSKVRAVLLIGEAAGLIKKDLRGTTTFFDCGTLDKAVKKAAALSDAGDTVLLSPACASFDQFNDFEERGKVFKTLVRQLKY
jgi:UDP-N-acetylmuramoylalanine--D-glutamate ligase